MDARKENKGSDFSREVGRKEKRRLRAIRTGKRSAWLGLGMLGLIGWSVAIPSLAGVALGLWIDRHYPGKFSWTLMLLIGGLITGSLNAWRWVEREKEEIQQEEEDNHE